MRRRVRWHDRRNGSSSVQLHGWSRHQAHDRAEIAGTVQAANPRYHAKGQGRQHQDDNGRAGYVYAGLARLFRLLRNTRGAGRSHSLGPVAAAGRSLASVENTTASPNGTGRAESLGVGCKEHGRQRPRPLVSRSQQSSLYWALKCILQIARPAILVPIVLAQLLEPPCTDPYARWCGRGGAARLPPIPIAATLCVGTFETCRRTLRMSVYQGRPEVARTSANRRFWTHCGPPTRPRSDVEAQGFATRAAGLKK